MSTDHLLLKALDGRAASFEKLDRLQLALRDAKEMIDISPKVSKVSLRLMLAMKFLMRFRATCDVGRFFSSRSNLH